MPPEYSGRLRRAPVQAHNFEALGTNCSVFAIGLSRGRLLEAEFWVRRLGARLTRFSPDSELSRFNASPGGWRDVSPELESLLRESLRAFETSAGLVNVAVLRSMEAVGYTRPLSEGRPVATERRACPVPALVEVLAVRRGAARPALPPERAPDTLGARWLQAGPRTAAWCSRPPPSTARRQR